MSDSCNRARASVLHARQCSNCARPAETWHVRVDPFCGSIDLASNCQLCWESFERRQPAFSSTWLQVDRDEWVALWEVMTVHGS